MVFNLISIIFPVTHCSKTEALLFGILLLVTLFHGKCKKGEKCSYFGGVYLNLCLIKLKLELCGSGCFVIITLLGECLSGQ